MTNPLEIEGSHRHENQPLGILSETLQPGETIAASAGQSADEVQFLLESESIADAKDKQIVLDARAFLAVQGEKNVDDVARHATKLGSVIEGYAMSGSDSPKCVDLLYARFELLQRQGHIADARKELSQPEPNLLTLLACLRKASSNSASLPAEIAEEIANLKRDIQQRDLRNEAYDQMLSLSLVLREALPHLKGAKIRMDAESTVAALISGAFYPGVFTKNIVPNLRNDEGKNGPQSQAELQSLAVKIEAIMPQLQAAAS